MTESETVIRLTQYSGSSGCGCKIEPAVLERILNDGNLQAVFPSLIAGYETKDDAAVWDLDEENYLLCTTDFFTPIVDDPYDFGRISAANAISDIYAMGGKPIFSLAVLGFPVCKLGVDVAKKIIAGAKSICKEAGIPIAGGHSINIPEPVFGLVVNGFVNKKNLKKNNTAKSGDVLFLTKPLGAGIMASAMKKEKISEEDIVTAVSIMSRLNSIGEKLGGIEGVHAMTDVTGFGFLGHLIELCEGSNVSARIDYSSVPLMPGIEKYTSQLIFPDSTYRNWNAFEKKVKGIEGSAFITLCDPQTSGGLLVAVGKNQSDKVIQLLNDHKLGEFIKPIGHLTDKSDFVVEVSGG